MKFNLLVIGLLFLAFLFFIGFAISNLPFDIIVILIIGFIFAVLTLMNLEVGLFLLIFVVPFTQQFTLIKSAIGPVDIGTDDVFIIFIILSWLARLATRKDVLVLKTSLNWPIVAFFTCGMFSYIGGLRVFGTGIVGKSAFLVGFLHLMKFFEYVVVYFIVVSAIRDLKQIKKILIMFFVVTGLLAILQFIFMFQFGYFSLSAPPPPSFIYIMAMRAFGTNAILGAYYAFFLSILLVYLLDVPVAKGKVPLVLFAILLSFALFNTYSRSAYFGLMAGFVILAKFKEKRLFLIILLLAVFSPIYLQSAVLERITLTVSVYHPKIVLDASSAIRLDIWKKGLQVFLNNFIFGTGYWTTRWVLRAEAHNQYLAILIEMGIVGFSVFCWLLVRMFKNALTLIKKTESGFLNSLGLGYIAGLTAVLASCFFSETLESFRMTGPIWFIAGLIASANRLLSEKKKEADLEGIT